MTYQVSARTKRGGSVGVFVETAREALSKADQYLEDGLIDVVFRGNDSKIIEFEVMKALAET